MPLRRTPDRRAPRAASCVSLRYGLGSSRTRWFPWSPLFLNPHIAWYMKSNPVSVSRIPRITNRHPLNRFTAGDSTKRQAGECSQPKEKRLERGANHGSGFRNAVVTRIAGVPAKVSYRAPTVSNKWSRAIEMPVNHGFGRGFPRHCQPLMKRLNSPLTGTFRPR